MASAPNAAALAFYAADGCARILVPLLCFLGRASPRSPAVDEAAVFLLLVLPTAYLAGVILAHFAGVVLAYLHLAAPALSLADTVRFAVMLFTLVSAWLLLIGLPVAAFSYLAAGKRGAGPGFSWNLLS